MYLYRIVGNKNFPYTYTGNYILNAFYPQCCTIFSLSGIWTIYTPATTHMYKKGVSWVENQFHIPSRIHTYTHTKHCLPGVYDINTQSWMSRTHARTYIMYTCTTNTLSWPSKIKFAGFPLPLNPMCLYIYHACVCVCMCVYVRTTLVMWWCWFHFHHLTKQSVVKESLCAVLVMFLWYLVGGYIM